VITLSSGDPEELARRWLEVDPDTETRAETERLIEAGGTALTTRFGRHLEFGTAGLRGRLGTGPNRMNRVIVRLVAAAIATEVADEPDPHVVIGFDARHGSSVFATDTARVLLARGVRCTILPRPLPTPVLAHTVRQLAASAGVMVTASHNPRDDNGYKVYGRGGALLTAPTDERIATTMRTTPLLGDLDLVPEADGQLAPGPEHLVDDYVDTVLTTLAPGGSRSARAVHTALHGVGTEVIVRAFAAAGFPELTTVAGQAEPDPDFPTTPFPNPEEPGTLDLLFALGDEQRADLALANDPDADRLAVAVPTETGWHLLSGDDLGCLLADHLLARPSDDPRTPLVVTTVTSSRLLQRIADAHDAAHVETLTGFKWIMDAGEDRPDHRLVCGYEEALGYAVNERVPDKDGVSAALAITELASDLKDHGRTLLDRLDELHRRHGVHATGQRSIRFETTPEGPSAQEAAMARLRGEPPTSIGGFDVGAVHDLAEEATGLPPTNGLVITLGHARLVIRPSGTEPKMKVYGEVVSPVDDYDLASVRASARAELRHVLDAAVRLVCAFDADPASPPTAPRPEVERVFSTPSTGRSRRADLALIIRCIDLTTLEGDDTAARIRALCAQARRPDVADPSVGPVAAVCVYPELVSLASELLGGANVGVASVAGAFPAGLSSLAVRVADIENAVANGADDVDIVLNRSALLDGRTDVVAAELAASRKAAGGAHLKVILEVGELDERRIAAAAHLAMDAGADFIKTSTGKTAANATPESVWTMAEAIKAHAEQTGRRVGLKIAGGVRTADDAIGYVNIARSVLGEEWLTPELLRFGASSLLDAVVAALDEARSAASDP
jgi:phosphomannomutase